MLPPLSTEDSNMRKLVTTYLPGILLTGLIAAIGMMLANMTWATHLGLSGLTMAILLGIVVGNTCYPRLADKSHAGIQFAKGKLLRSGVVLYGLKITFWQIASVGINAILIDIVVLSSTMLLAYWLGTRYLKLDRDTALLIGAGSSICGAAAVMATEPVLKAHANKVSIAVATVVVFGTLSMFIYPLLFHFFEHKLTIFNNQLSYGIFAGSTIHEVAQVFAAGQAVGNQAADSAVIVKMIRVMMLAPVLLLMSALVARRTDGSDERKKITIPWFALLFIVMAITHSLGIIPARIIILLVNLDTILLSMAMAALGVTTHLQSIRAAGIKPLLLGSLLFAYLIVGGGIINMVINRL
jgi:uncharacterized integral membrane protein (TIGR00698 family)